MEILAPQLLSPCVHLVWSYLYDDDFAPHILCESLLHSCFSPVHRLLLDYLGRDSVFFREPAEAFKEEGFLDEYWNVVNLVYQYTLPLTCKCAQWAKIIPEVVQSRHYREGMELRASQSWSWWKTLSLTYKAEKQRITLAYSDDSGTCEICRDSESDETELTIDQFAACICANANLHSVIGAPEHDPHRLVNMKCGDWWEVASDEIYKCFTGWPDVFVIEETKSNGFSETHMVLAKDDFL